jgi:catechol 2,3-dioxygenase-like lactoylglutathione lyase family enzyme
VAITGAHVLLYTPAPDELPATLRDVFGWEHVDAGDGWLILALPPAELGAHPGEAPSHELMLMCDDIGATADDIRSRGVDVGEVEDMGFGLVVTATLPGGVEMMVYEPRHASPIAPGD